MKLIKGKTKKEQYKNYKKHKKYSLIISFMAFIVIIYLWYKFPQPTITENSHSFRLDLVMRLMYNSIPFFIILFLIVGSIILYNKFIKK